MFICVKSRSIVNYVYVPPPGADTRATEDGQTRATEDGQDRKAE